MFSAFLSYVAFYFPFSLLIFFVFLLCGFLFSFFFNLLCFPFLCGFLFSFFFKLLCFPFLCGFLISFFLPICFPFCSVSLPGSLTFLTSEDSSSCSDPPC